MTTRATPVDRPMVRRFALPAGALAILLSQQMALAGNTWDGGGGDDNWGTGDNWSPNGTPSYGTATFAGTTRTSPVLNINYNMNQLNFTGTSAWTLNSSGGSVLSLFDFGGTQAKIENNSSGALTINAPITFAANNGSPPNPFGEINAIGADITFGTGTLTVNGSSVNGIKLFGGGRTTTFNNTVSATGKWFGLTATNTTMAVGGAFTSGDIYVMNGGTLKVNSGGTITSSAIRLGGDFGNTGNQNQTLGGTLQFTSLTGGQTFSSVINTVTGNTSNALLIDSLNTSGTNTLSAASFLDSDLKVQVASGGTLSFTGGSIDVKIRKLTVAGAGTTIINEPLTSSLGAGGLLVKEGAGTLILQGTANTYTGTNSATLNANGTQIAGGTLGIYGDGSLGLAPAGAYNNIQFTGSATLQDTANNISLNAKRNISIASGATASFDSNGNTFTINGIVNGTGGKVEKSGIGTVILTGTNNYTGTTTVTTGTLLINGNNSAANGAVSVTATTTLGGSGTVGGATTFTGASIHAPGSAAATVGTQTFSSTLAYGSGTVFNWDLDVINSNASSYDKVTAAGAITGGAAVFKIVLAAGDSFANTFWDSTRTWTDIFGGAGAAGINLAGIFSGFDASGGVTSTGLVSGQGQFTLSNVSNTLTWTAVPEPSSALASLLIAAGLLRRRRV